MAPTGLPTPRACVTAGACAVVLWASFLGGSHAGKLYRWVDEDGNVHYTDRMPAEATREKHSVMDESGVVLEDKESLEDERARRAQREAERADAEQRAEEERRKREEQRRRDRIITQTFSTERDIRLTRDNRVESVEVQIRILDQGIERLQSRRKQQVERYERLGEDSPAARNARERIDTIDARLAQRFDERRALVAKRAEIEQRFAQYLQRFRELIRDEQGN